MINYVLVFFNIDNGSFQTFTKKLTRNEKNKNQQNGKIYNTPVRNTIYICYFTIISMYKIVINVRTSQIIYG